MTTEKNDITVKIMDRDFNVKCPTDKISDLHKAAKYFDNKLRETHRSDDEKKLINIDNLIVITALNITHELLTQKHQNHAYIDHMNEQINNLQNKIEQALVEEA
jgi:cell division protein ZapA